MNLPSHALTNGYGDLTPLIPELLDVVVLTRGPFDVRFGANALGGSTQFITQDRPAGGAVLTGGNYDFARGFATYPAVAGAVTGYVSLLGGTTSGYRDNADLEQINTFNKFLFPMPGGTGSVRVQVFSDRFGAPGFVRRERVENGTLSPRAAVNSTDGGKTDLKFSRSTTNSTTTSRSRQTLTSCIPISTATRTGLPRFPSTPTSLDRTCKSMTA